MAEKQNMTFTPGNYTAAAVDDGCDGENTSAASIVCPKSVTSVVIIDTLVLNVQRKMSSATTVRKRVTSPKFVCLKNHRSPYQLCIPLLLMSLLAM